MKKRWRLSINLSRRCRTSITNGLWEQTTSKIIYLIPSLTIKNATSNILTLFGPWSFSGRTTGTNLEKPLRFSSWLKRIDLPSWFDYWPGALPMNSEEGTSPTPQQEVWPIDRVEWTSPSLLKQEANLCNMCSKQRFETSGILDAGWPC